MAEPIRLMMAQVDDVPGELLGEFIRRAESLGARNVQVVASVTKKGRPGYIVYVDVPGEIESEVAFLLGSELGAWGYRVLNAEHHHFEIERFSVPLEVDADDATYSFTIRMKTVSRSGTLLRVKAEHDDLASICRTLREAQHQVPVMVLKASVESQFSNQHLTGAPLRVKI
ncbi:nickel insertion protein [Thiobacillus sp.]|uniref:nickel insertion protein n=1 Tax=Thiobacillus sp. TaxID=924 RepID=UPI0025E6F635|nr:nickel insertion protein [Thiobacillus sp.]